jgi:transcriptional regulator with XRE-family HTH domain
MNIGKKIKTLREIRNLTQSHLAKELGLTQSAYSKIELGEVEISFSKLETVAKVLGMKPEEIVTFNEAMVFNVSHNQTGNGYVYNAQSEHDKALYEEQISQLKAENTYLKTVIDKLLVKE